MASTRCSGNNMVVIKFYTSHHTIVTIIVHHIKFCCTDPLRYPFLNFADPNLRPVNFSWSPVTPDCLAIHYNILASGSNCVSCPTTMAINGYYNTKFACTEISTDNNTCVFAVRSVVCGKITGNAEANNGKLIT